MKLFLRRRKAVRCWQFSSPTKTENKFSPKYMVDSLTWKIGGEAGFGIMAAGTMLARAYARRGYHVFATNEYPSLIRGGHNLITVRIAVKPFSSMNRDVHILIAL